MPSFPTRFLRPRAPAAGRARERWGQGPDGSAPTAGTVLTSPSEEEQQGGYSLWRSTASYDAEAESVSAWVLRVTRVTAEEALRKRPAGAERAQPAQDPGAA